jgi:hypothetical protein
VAIKPTKPAVSKIKIKSTPVPMPTVKSRGEQDSGVKVRKSPPKKGSTQKPKKAPAKPQWEKTWTPRTEKNM